MKNKKPKILFLSPGASYTGVPILFINMLKWLKTNAEYDINILTAFEGPLENEFHKLATTFRWDGWLEPAGINRFYFYRLAKRIINKVITLNEKSYKERLIDTLKEKKYDLIYANSVASCGILREIIDPLNCKVILHVRELEISVFQFCGTELFHSVIPRIALFIADSEAVRNNLLLKHGIDEEKVVTVYEFINYSAALQLADSIDVDYSIRLKKSLNIPEDAFVVISSGTTDWRKGADLVVHIARKVYEKTEFPVHFVWIGGDNVALEFQKLYYDLVKLNLQNSIHFLGIKENPLEYFAIADVFMLCSREEPVGIVALEAASLKKPVICFDCAGGMPEFVEDDCGFIVPYLDLDAMAGRIIQLHNDRNLLRILGENAAGKVKRHDINIACTKISGLINSVIESE